jgi:hypothetical protein
MKIYNKQSRTMTESKDIRELLRRVDYSKAMDLRDTPIGDICVCGCEVFVMLGGFVDGEVSFYFLDGECASCGSMVTLPTPKEDNDACL